MSQYTERILRTYTHLRKSVLISFVLTSAIAMVQKITSLFKKTLSRSPEVDPYCLIVAPSLSPLTAPAYSPRLSARSFVLFSPVDCLETLATLSAPVPETEKSLPSWRPHRKTVSTEDFHISMLLIRETYIH